MSQNFSLSKKMVTVVTLIHWEKKNPRPLARQKAITLQGPKVREPKIGIGKPKKFIVSVYCRLGTIEFWIFLGQVSESGEK